VTLVPVPALPVESIDQVRSIYEAGFPPDQRFPFLDLLRDHAFALVEADEPVALVVYRPLQPAGWVFVRYFVAGTRGVGVGSRLWAAFVELLGSTGQTRVVLDLDDPDEDGVDAGERRIRERRIAFYQRLGLQLLPVRSYLPPHDGPVHPMQLMAVDLRGHTGLPPRADLRAVVIAVYRDRYGLDESHPTVRTTLRASGLDRPL
jgi:hypothetical protein